MLVWNSFHQTDSGEGLLTPKNFDLAFIPSSLTLALQAPNKYLNMPFKTRDPAQYQDWMGNGPFIRKEVGTEERTCVEVGKQTVAGNPAELVIKSFLSCSISNALDGTENDAVYEEKTEGGESEDADDELEIEFDTCSKSEDE